MLLDGPAGLMQVHLTAVGLLIVEARSKMPFFLATALTVYFPC
jgi:hypothetical protein